MGIESLRSRQTFGLEELGLLDTTPVKAIDTATRLFSNAIQAPTVAFFVFDDRSSSLVIRSVISNVDQRTGWLGGGNATSLCSMVRDEVCPISIDDTSTRSDVQYAIERKRYGAVGYLGAPVIGPHSEVVGVLAAMTSTPRPWTRLDHSIAQDHAFIMSEQVMLRAALETLKLMARERAMFSAISQSRN